MLATLVLLAQTGGLISLLIWLLVLAVVVYLIFLVIGMLPIPEPIKTVITVVIALILLLSTNTAPGIPLMPTFGSETYRSQNPLESIKPRETHPYFLQSESIRGPDHLAEIIRLQPATAVAGSADFQLTVIGSGFLKGSVINWNGADVLTTYVNPNTLRTTITPQQGPGAVPVMVKNNKTLSLHKIFTFTL